MEVGALNFSSQFKHTNTQLLTDFVHTLTVIMLLDYITGVGTQICMYFQMFIILQNLSNSQRHILKIYNSCSLICFFSIWILHILYEYLFRLWVFKSPSHLNESNFHISEKINPYWNVISVEMNNHQDQQCPSAPLTPQHYCLGLWRLRLPSATKLIIINQYLSWSWFRSIPIRSNMMIRLNRT